MSSNPTGAPAGVKRIAYQGEPGSNSHLVCKQHHGDAETLPCPSFEEAFAAVSSGAADLAMIPIDNSIAGRVADIHHFLPTSGLHVVGEHFLPIEFMLMSIDRAELDSIKTVHSHVHALGQCRSIISQHGWTPHISGDTAGAAREIAEAQDITQAAIAPALAADIYDLKILQRDIEDEPDNTTRFLELAREPHWPEPGADNITTFVFTIRNLPAALYKALGGFATNDVNMTKLESYMVNGLFDGATQFLIEVEGHPDEPALARAIAELRFFTKDVTILGVYPADAARQRPNSTDTGDPR